MKTRLAASVIMYCILNAHPACAAPPPAAVVEAAAEVVKARSALLQLPADGETTDVSPAAMSAIQQMRAALEQLITAYVAALPGDRLPDAARTERELNALVPKLPQAQDGGRYGQAIQFEAAAAKEPALLSVAAVFSIECGSDSLLLIFEQRGKERRKALRWQSPAYTTIAGAHQGLRYAIAPPDAAGRWWLLAVDSPAWCTSCWSTLRFHVLRPAADKPDPAAVFEGERSLYACDETAPVLTAGRDSFELRFAGGSIDAEVLIRPHVLHYDLKDGRFVRGQPVADSPRDFVDEWLSAPWEDAARWCAGLDLQKMQQEHKRLRELNEQDTPAFGADAPVPETPGATRVELSYQNAPGRSFIVTRQGAAFMLTGITETAR